MSKLGDRKDLPSIIDDTANAAKEMCSAQGAVVCMSNEEGDELMRVDYLPDQANSLELILN